MSAGIDMSNNQANIAFLGSRNDIWHRMGQQALPGWSIDQWATGAGLAHTVLKVPAIADLRGGSFGHVSDQLPVVPYRNFLVRSDTGAALGYVSDIYQPVQPAELLAWFERYLSVDDRFQLDCAGSLHGGATIWATAVFRDTVEVAGDKHLARVLMTTTYDGSGSTVNQGTVTRVVCANTLAMATADGRAVVKTRHNTKFDAKRVALELGRIAQGFETFKKMGDAMVQVEMAKEEVSQLFKTLLDIKPEDKPEDISTRKMNQFQALSNAYRSTVAEGTPTGTVWAALNAVTRYVDHDRPARGNGVPADVKQFTSSQFGSGAGMKQQAMQLLMPRVKDKVLIAA